MFEFPPSEIKNRLLSYYADGGPYTTYLAAAAALHPTDSLTIEGFKELIYGDATDSKEIKSWPSLAVTSGDVISIQKTQQGRTVFWQTQIYIRYFLRISNLELLQKTVDRHLEATMLMFEEAPYRSIGGACDEFEFLRAEITDSVRPLGATAYVRGMEVQWEARHR